VLVVWLPTGVVVGNAEVTGRLRSLAPEATGAAGTTGLLFGSGWRNAGWSPCQELQRLSDGKRVFTAHARTRGVYPLDEAQEPLNPRDIIPHTPVVAFGALGNPAAFFTHLRRDGWNLRDTLAFRDHHPYTQADLDKLALGVEQTKAHALITTAKDAVKLRGLRCRVPCYVVKIALEITDADELRALVCGAVRL
jgi:tetraacyldisaccharide 4'-kinase